MPCCPKGENRLGEPTATRETEARIVTGEIENLSTDDCKRRCGGARAVNRGRKPGGPSAGAGKRDDSNNPLGDLALQVVTFVGPTTIRHVQATLDYLAGLPADAWPEHPDQSPPVLRQATLMGFRRAIGWMRAGHSALCDSKLHTGRLPEGVYF